MDIIFCGNPGVGKSTLLSSISNLRFESGINWGEGLTTELALKSHSDLVNVRFADTPGFADIQKAELAAKAITTALKDAAEAGKQSMIFFVVTLESGRVRPDDLFTIKQVMDSIVLRDSGRKPGPNSYGVIFNKCTFLEESEFLQGGKQKLEKIFGLQTTMVPFTTTYLHFLPLVPQLVDQSNCSYVFPGLLDWLYAFPGIEIGNVEKIDVSDIETKLRKMKDVHCREISELELKLSRQNEREMEEMKKMMEESRHDIERRIGRMEEERSRTGFFEDLQTFITTVASAFAPIPLQLLNRK